jgi:hypothetical protein
VVYILREERDPMACAVALFDVEMEINMDERMIHVQEMACRLCTFRIKNWISVEVYHLV